MKKILKIFPYSFSKKNSLIDPTSFVSELKFLKILKNTIFTDFRSEIIFPLLFFILILLSQIILIKKLFFFLLGISVIGLAFLNICGFKKYVWCLVIFIFYLVNTYKNIQNVDYFNELVSA